jgi:hypothetical protein
VTCVAPTKRKVRVLAVGRDMPVAHSHGEPIAPRPNGEWAAHAVGRWHHIDFSKVGSRKERETLDSPLSLILLVGVVGAIWFWRAHHDRRHAAEKELRRICLGNERQVERLIESEMTRVPGMSRPEAARRAVERYRRDNR